MKYKKLFEKIDKVTLRRRDRKSSKDLIEKFDKLKYLYNKKKDTDWFLLAASNTETIVRAMPDEELDRFDKDFKWLAKTVGEIEGELCTN